MNYLKKFLILIVSIVVVSFSCSSVYAALYQFDDVSGTSGCGAQWVGFINYSPVYGPEPYVGPNSIGAPTTIRMQANANLISNSNSVFLRGNINPLHTLYLVIPEGVGTLSLNFEYTGNLPAVTLGVYGGNFETSYPTIINYPTPGDGPSVNVDLTVQKRPGESKVYDSNMGELIFHQNPTTVPSQTLHIPFVIANVHDGSAQYAPLDIKSTTRNKSGDIVGRRWFKWDVLSDKSVEADPVDWIFVPIQDPVIDKNEFVYNFTTEVINHTGLRYGIQRYDDNRTIMAAHWKFDLQPISGRLPRILHLNPLSHIVPGLVTIYSHDAKVTVGQQRLLRLAAVDTTGQIIGSKLLELKYRTIYGYDLGSVQDTSTWTNRNSLWGLNSFRVYQSNRNFFSEVLKTMESKNENYFFPSRPTNVLLGKVKNTFPPVTADALSSFTLSAPVPFTNMDVLSKDANGNDVWISSDVFPNASAMLGLNVTLRIPKTNRFIAEHWDSFAASRNLANDFARYFSVWFRSPEGFDLNLSQYLKDESKYDRVMKVYIDEENECITLNYVTLLIEEGDGGDRRRPKIRMVSDTSTVNDYDYIAVNDGVDDGKWELVFYVAPAEATPTYPKYPSNPQSDTGGGGGCTAYFIPFWILLAIFSFPSKKAFEVISSSILMFFVLCFASFAAMPPVPELVIYESDATTTGTLRYAINKINNGGNASNIIMIDNLHQINITSPLVLEKDMVIEGNGASISGNRTFRLFKVTNGAKVHFRNMTFMNGSDTADDRSGGAVTVGIGSSVYFDKCTFTQNVASGDGGAVYSDGFSYFTNCTFYNNSSTNGGAVYGSPSSSLSFSFVTMNSNECTAPDGGHAVNAKGGQNEFQASVITGNGSGGNELVCFPITRSLGYNLFGDSSFHGTSHETDLHNISSEQVFGSTIIFHRNDAAPGWRNWPYTIALINRSGNPAIAIIPVSYINSAGVFVDQRFVVRTSNSRLASAGSYEVYNPEIPVISLEIGGIPNGIATIGFTVQLRAYTLPASANPGVMWRSDDSSVVAVTPGGRVYSVGNGTTILWATSTGYDGYGKRISKHYLVKVGKDVASSDNPPVPESILENSDKKSENSSSGGCNFWFGGGIVLLVMMSLVLGKRAKKIFFLSLFFFMILLNASIAFGESFTVDLNYSILQIVRNQPVFFLTASPQPAGVGYIYYWSTTNSSVVDLTSATTSTVGIYGTGRGKAFVICEVTSNDGITKATASCEVTVFDTGMSRVSIVPSQVTLQLRFAERARLVPDHQPVGAEPINFTWTTDNVGVVSVDNNGNVLARDKGTATITYTAIAIPIGGGDPTSFDATCRVTVLRPVLSIDISHNPSPVIVGGRGIINVSYFPEDADSADIVWTSSPSDPSVVSIEPTSSTTATFNALGFPAPNRTPGQNPVTVTASSLHWKNISFVPDVNCEIVIDPIQISEVRVTPSTPSVISRDYRLQMSHTVAPANSTKASDFWSSSNQLVAAVSESGLVTGINQGQADISYTFNGWIVNRDGTHSPNSKSAYTTVIVTSPPPGFRVSEIEIEPTRLRLPRGASSQLRAWVSPYYATNKTIYWSSGNLLVASVNKDGLVTAHNPGTTQIYAEPADKGIDGQVGPVSCEITVYDDSVIGDPAHVNIPIGLQNKIEQMNSPLKREGLEVNFGFLLNKPKVSTLTAYGSYPMIISEISELTRVDIGLAKPVDPKNMEPVARSAEFEIDVSSYTLSGITPILPVSLKLTLTENTIKKYLPQFVEGILRDPRQYFSQLFSTFTFQKQIIDVPEEEIHFVSLFNNLNIVLEAEKLGIILVKSLGDKLEFTLNYYVVDSSKTDVNILEGNLIIGDGAKNGIIRDPIWIFVDKVEEEKESNTREKSSGCRTAGLNVVIFIAILTLCCIIYMRVKNNE